MEKVKIKQATQKGYIECAVGGVADLSYPSSKTRRGRVQEGGWICPTITATETGICRIEEVIHMSIALRNRREAYDQIEPKRPNRKAMILDVLTSGDPGGMTADEIGEKLVSEGKIPTNSPNFTRPRLTEMKAEGKVVIVGRRPGKSGCNTAVWKVKR